MSPPPLHARLLGGFDLRREGERIEVEPGRIQSLLAFLLLNRTVPQARQRIAFLFWPDSDDAQARTNLRNLLHRLRKDVPELEAYLDVRGRSVGWADGVRVSVDVERFREAADRAEASGARELLEAAVDAWTGDLLPGVYADWLAEEQDRLRNRFLSLLSALVEALEREGDPLATARAARRLLRENPLDEQAHRRLIRAHVAAGERARAVQAYHACAQVLERELGIAPDRATRDAYESAVGLSDAPSPGVAMAAERAPLTGREREWSALLEARKAAAGGPPRLVLVRGEAGIGKSRLVEELGRLCRREAAPWSRARSWAAEGALAYAPVVEWLRSDPFRGRLAALDPPLRRELATLLPELVEGTTAPPESGLSEPERRRRLHAAVERVLLSGPSPVTLAAEDLQWCDAETLRLVHHLVRRPSGALLVVGTLRDGEAGAGHPVHEVVSSLTALDRCTTLELERLPRGAATALAAGILRRPLEPDEAEGLHRYTDGNPLFIVEALRDRAGPGDPSVRREPIPESPELSPRVHALLRARLERLSPMARKVAGVAATVGRELPWEVLVRAADPPPDALARALDELWRRRLVRHREDGTYDFTHDRIREVAYLEIGPALRARLHERVGRALEEVYGAGAVAGRVAWHLDRAGRGEEAVERYVAAASAAREVSAHDEVVRLLARALELVEGLPPGPGRDRRELVLRLEIGASRVARGGYASLDVQENYARAEALCRRLGRRPGPPILRALAIGALARNRLPRAEELGVELREWAEREGDELVAVEARYVQGVSAFWAGRLHESRRRLEEALAAYRPGRHTEHVALYLQDPGVVCHARLAWTSWLLGDPERAVRERNRALDLAEGLEDPYSRAYALWFSLFIAIEAEDRRRIRDQAFALQEVALEHDLDYLAAVAGSFLGYLQTLDGQVAGGVERMREALDDPRAHGQEFVLRPQTLTLLARALEGARRVVEGLEAVDEGLAFTKGGARVWAPDLLRQRGRLLARNGAPEGVVDEAFRCALDVAREQGSAWGALRAAVDWTAWTDRRGPVPEGRRELLAQARSRLPDDVPLALLQEADRLLGR